MNNRQLNEARNILSLPARTLLNKLINAENKTVKMLNGRSWFEIAAELDSNNLINYNWQNMTINLK